MNLIGHIIVGTVAFDYAVVEVGWLGVGQGGLVVADQYDGVSRLSNEIVRSEMVEKTDASENAVQFRALRAHAVREAVNWAVPGPELDI